MTDCLVSGKAEDLEEDLEALVYMSLAQPKRPLFRRGTLL